MDDLIKRADAIAYIDRVINSGLGRNKSLDYIHKYISALPSADTVSREFYEDAVKANIRLVIENRELKEQIESAEATAGDYPNDLISRSALMEYCSNQKSKSIDNNDIARFPSADAEPTVIRSRTLMPTKDFKEWAKRIREENPNVIVIPCDAEVVSAE